MNRSLDLAILRVYDQSQQVIGTAFLVDDTRALTCAHVIRQALGIDGEIKVSQQLTIRVDFPLLPGQNSSSARIAYLDFEKDIAGIELTGEPPTGTQPVKLTIPDGELWEHEFRALGFSMPEGAWASGVLRGRNAEGWIQIEDTKSTGYAIQPGFSGSPVWDENLQAVVGMIVAAERNQMVKAAFCIPTELLVRWDALKNHVRSPNQTRRLFISYKRDAQPDQNLMEFLAEGLTNQGYSVFTDAEIRKGENWLIRIDEELSKSDFLVVLLSASSADSEMVQSEIFQASEYRRKYGHPQVLPVRVAYKDMLPYTISAFLNPLQYVAWNNTGDNKRVVEELIQAMQGQLPPQEPPTTPQHTRVEENVVKPVPAFDARILDELQMPGGTVRLQDKFYVERTEDTRFRNEMKRLGATVTIRAARQAGKSSLLVRGIQQAKQAGVNTILLDMQRVGKVYLASPDIFMRYFADYVMLKLSQDTAIVDPYWRRSLSPQEKLTSLMEERVLETLDHGLVIGMDEIDRLLETSWYTEFFGLLRSWHNLRAIDERWDKLSNVMVISTEPYLLIADANQSPFNVGSNLYLQDFNIDQVSDLNQRHQSPVDGAELDELAQFYGGHPFLTRKALYLLVAEGYTWKKLRETSPDDLGPFGDHLRRYHWMIQQDLALKDALKSIIRNNTCPEDLLHRLLQAGLVKASGDVARCRCELYRVYFEEKL